jgi:hypothetical protein
MELAEKHFPDVGRECGPAHPAQAVHLATNHETVEVKVAPIECDLEQVVQHGDAAVAGHVQTPPYRRVDLEEQDVELVNFGRSVWLDHSRSRSLVVALFSPRFFPVSYLPRFLLRSGLVGRKPRPPRRGGFNPAQWDE